MAVSKYKNVPVIVDGRRFASRAEAKRYGELRLLETARKISGLELQVPFKLSAYGKPICKYIADFNYYDNEKGIEVTEDVKSKATAKLPLFRLKAKLFEAQYGYPITIIGGKK